MTFARIVGCACLSLAACATAPVPTSRPRAEAALEEGQRALKQGRFLEAIGPFQRALAEAPRSTAAMRGLVEAHFRAGRIAQFVRDLEAAVAARPGEATLHYGLGMAYFTRSADSEGAALRELTRALEIDPGEAEFHYRIGVVHLEAERFTEAASALERARDLDPRVARHHVSLAAACSRAGNRAGALAALRALLACAPDSLDLKVARDVMKRLTDPFREFPKAVEAAFERGLDALDREDAPQPAIVAFEEILEGFPDLAVVHAALGLAFQRIDEVGRALDELNRAVELAPDDSRNHIYLGDLYFARERFDRAAEAYRAAVERDPLADRAYERLGQIALTRGDAGGAARHLHALTVLRPDDAGARRDFAAALLALGRPAEAETQLMEALSRDPTNVEILLRLGSLCVERLRSDPDPTGARRWRERAVGFFERALNLQPHNAFAARALESLRR